MQICDVLRKRLLFGGHGDRFELNSRTASRRARNFALEAHGTRALLAGFDRAISDRVLRKFAQADAVVSTLDGIDT